jgi:hypothetical protein
MSEQDEIIRALEARMAELEHKLAAQDRGRLPTSGVSRRRLAAFGVALALLVVPGVVLASHQFPDVPTGHPFHGEISAIAGAGITAGFGDGGFHPADPVTRQAMAAFMQRGFGRTAFAIGGAPMTATVPVQAGTFITQLFPVRQLTITVPGMSNAFTPKQLVLLRGRVHFNASMNLAPTGCPCEFTAAIRDMTTNAGSPSQAQTFESSSGSARAYSFDVEALFLAPPGARTFQLEVGLNGRANGANEASFALDTRSSLSAMTFPFGPTGTSALSAAGAANVAPDR